MTAVILSRSTKYKTNWFLNGHSCKEARFVLLSIIRSSACPKIEEAMKLSKQVSDKGTSYPYTAACGDDGNLGS